MSDYIITSRYARYLPNLKRRTTWEEQVDMMKDMHLQKYADKNINDEIEWAFDLVKKKVILGSQRALQFAGTPILKKNARIYNCSFSYCDRPRFFQEMFWLQLVGAGTGISGQKHHIAKLPEIQKRGHEHITYVIDDSIEGWADSLGVLMSSYFVKDQPFPEYFGKKVKFDFSLIRPKGASLTSGVGKAPGSDGLKYALKQIELLLESIVGNSNGPIKLKPINAYDILMHASDSVLSGGIRRSASIFLFSIDDDEMMKAKTGNWNITNPQRARANNSVLLIRGETSHKDFKKIIKYTKEFGEPGFIWADNREYGINPCAEVGLFAYETFEDENGATIYEKNGFPKIGRSGWEFCNLAEINGAKIKSEEDFAIAAKAAALIGTLQAGYTDIAYLGEVTEKIIRKESLLGVSLTGMMDNPDIIFNEDIQKRMAKIVLDENERIAKKIGINVAARACCLKPSGTASLILSSASGVHPHHAKRYFRRVQNNKQDPVLKFFKKHNPRSVEESVWSEGKTDEIITFCVEVEHGAKTKNQLNAIALLELVKKTQQNWVFTGMRPERCVTKFLRHNVSNTIHILNDDEWDKAADYIYENKEFFTGVSLVSHHCDKDYKQAPNCAVYTEQEILDEYGAGCMMASGLIVDGMYAFENDLWEACSAVLNLGNPLTVDELRNILINNIGSKKYKKLNVSDSDEVLEAWLNETVENLELKRDWIRRARQFAKRYFENNIKKMTYCLKDVNNLKLWHDLHREWEKVDYTQLIEHEDNTKVQETVACAGGACELRL